MPEIGATLREARMRERIDVSEIEAQTKIRAKYLRALENEEWGLLPGPTFVKSFLRTYAQALGLDDKALVEEYRLHHERPSEGMLEPIVSSSGRSSTGRGRSAPSGPSRGYLLAVGTILMVIVVLVVLLVTGGSSKNKGATTSTTTTTKAQTGHKAKPRRAKTGASAGGDEVALSLTPTAAIYVCLIGDNGRKLIPGLELQAGESTSTYHAKRFEITLGNNSVTLYIDGHPRPVPSSSQAIGYSITKARGRHTLTSTQQPTCK
ncbi:MAG TPA: helix-turn-helix domain-containing protein [Solirubrobacteraceae bacterium]|jgi:cytoskeletal protein RodZ|nr:helix-turn-helix domain-containing protein [Solirubrobacteraceae bacterium]